MAQYGKSFQIQEKDNTKISTKNVNQSFLSDFITGKTSPRRLKIPLKIRLIFFRQLSVILQSGVPLSQGLELLAENMTNKNFSQCILNISNDLGSGQELSKTLKNYPKIFDPITVGLIEAGEAGGILSKVLERIALLLEGKSKLRGQIIGALVYPVIVLVLAVTVSLALLIFIVPTFEKLFDGLGAELPSLTKFMLTASRFVTSPYFFLIAPIFLFLVTFLFNQYYSTKNGRLIIDSLILKIPLFGDLILRSEMAGLSDTLSTLVESGLPIVESLEKCIVSSSNQVIRNSIKKAIILVKEGQLLSYSFSLSKSVPKIFLSMLKIGEETGELSFMLNNLSNFYKREVDETVSALTKAMEPAVIFVVAGIVGTIVIALYLPMFSLLENI